jgi:hypothetical protein
MLDGVSNGSKSLDFSAGLCLKTEEAVEFADADSANELRASIESQIPNRPSSSMATISDVRSGLKLSNLIEERMHRGDIQTRLSETISNFAMSSTNREIIPYWVQKANESEVHNTTAARFFSTKRPPPPGNTVFE